MRVNLLNMEDIAVIKSELAEGNLPLYRKNYLETILLYLNNNSYTIISEKTGVSLRQTQRLIAKYKVEGLTEQRKPGNTNLLTIEELAQIKKVLSSPPTKLRYLQQSWTSEFLAGYIKRKMKKEITSESCRKLINQYSENAKKEIPRTLDDFDQINSEIWLAGVRRIYQVTETENRKYKYLCVLMKARKNGPFYYEIAYASQLDGEFLELVRRCLKDIKGIKKNNIVIATTKYGLNLKLLKNPRLKLKKQTKKSLQVIFLSPSHPYIQLLKQKMRSIKA